MDFSAVKNNIAKACLEVGRDPAGIVIVAATKNRPATVIDDMYSLGVTIAGENRAQEFRDKRLLVTAPVEWHFIGRLQSNKIKYLAGNVSLVHSIDSLKILAALDAESTKRGVTTNYLIEINSGEVQKGGIQPGEALDFALAAQRFRNVKLKGIMTMLPDASAYSSPDSTSARLSTHDKAAKTLETICLRTKAVYDIIKNRFDGIEYLSMGMSADYITAIKCGANMIRLGTALFD